MVLEIRGRPVNIAVCAEDIGFIVKPAHKTVKEGGVDILGSVECGQCSFQLGKGLASGLKEGGVGAAKNVILIFVIWGR